jgi:S-methylmethionine-dependent homocysteine/selenocysteine methylase
MTAFSELLSIRSAGCLIVLDGAMGTELEARGAAMDGDAWCGLVNLTDPGLVQSVHEDHIRAGADVVITNTFMSGQGPMQRSGAGDQFEQGISNATAAAHAAVQNVAERPVVIAGSVGVTAWGQPLGEDSAGGADEHGRLREGYEQQIALLVDGGVDMIVLEMVTDVRLGRPALEAALASGLPVWLGLSMRIPGQDPSEYESLPDVEPEGRTIAEALLDPRLDAVTIMHTDIDDVSAALSMLRPLWSGTVGVYPHRGLWQRPHWTFLDVPDDQLVDLSAGWVQQGATMLGGCCGLRTHHVAALRAAVDAGRFSRR